MLTPTLAALAYLAAMACGVTLTGAAMAYAGRKPRAARWLASYASGAWAGVFVAGMHLLPQTAPPAVGLGLAVLACLGVAAMVGLAHAAQRTPARP